ncbi:hypothetical protein LPTSP4_08230 [Leptospira ryugenii]|uniref:Uncharacterized protein n=1 Tax=Leptospira ryugenii TaxID=1917863 RepID=A0A2P2DXF8_9LEPT|nr:DUF6428 family protein [Leptospira ryugenii]GBF49312.1 hypothetical protein LPTSP4_08230 [Leptospira ryugenii]
MKLSEIKNLLPNLNTLTFKLENGSSVPSHFHITEVGLLTKDFIDCGGTLRKETTINFQLWNSNDIEHRLDSQKLLKILHLAEEKLPLGDAEIEVEYQQDTIGKYDLTFRGSSFLLQNKNTACLASSQCGNSEKQDSQAKVTTKNSCCN